MTQDDLKLYTVKVGNGSGCLFQPLTDEYTYVITAKHLFIDDLENDQGQINTVQKPDGTQLAIIRNIRDGDIWNLQEIDITINYGENCFLHENADIALIKIQHQANFDVITAQDNYENGAGFFICGFPSANIMNAPGEQYRNNPVEGFGATGNRCQIARLNGGLNQEAIEGMSGGGLLRLNQEGISIIGIQSKMASRQFANGQVGFVPLAYAKEIIDDLANAGKLEKLFPTTLKNFSFLRDKAFLFDVDALYLQNATDARIALLNKAQNIIASDVTPIGIRDLFKERLLITEKDTECLNYNSIWIAWLEFLTLMNIVKYEEIDSSLLSPIFNSYRLKYVNVDDWTDVNIREEYGKSDYTGLPSGSAIFVSSNKSPKNIFNFPKGKLINVANAYDKTGFRTDKGIDPFTSFDFVHLDYFKTKCISQRIDEFAGLSEQEILQRLIEEYNELFS